VFYGYFGYITVPDKAAAFLHNYSGYYGGAINLINTVMYMYKGAELLFANNYATRFGGASYLC